MIQLIGTLFKRLWRMLRLLLWLAATVLRLTFGLAWRQTLGRSNVYVRRDWNDRGVGRVR